MFGSYSLADANTRPIDIICSESNPQSDARVTPARRVLEHSRISSLFRRVYKAGRDTLALG